MYRQRGAALSGVLFWGAVLALAVLLGTKIVPEILDYYQIKKSVAATAMNANGKTEQEIRAIYSTYAEAENIRTIAPADLEISRAGGKVVIAFGYERKIPLFPNVSLLVDFHGASAGRE